MFVIFSHLGCKLRSDLSFLPDTLVSSVILCDLLGESYLSVKNWPCSLWLEILFNLLLDFCDRNCGKLLVNFLG